MPALTLTARTSRAWLTRIIVIAFAFSLSVGAVGANETQARGVDLTPIIAAARNSQLAYEASMVAADRKLKSLKHDARRTQRKIRKVSRNLVGAKERRSVARRNVEDAKLLLQSALASIERTSGTGEELRVQSAPQALPLAPTETPASPILIEIHDQRDIAVPGGVVAGATVVVATADEVSALENKLKARKQRLRKSERYARKVQRAKLAKTRRLSSLKRQRRAALAQRSSSEAALKSRILSMSRLALRKATKKTKVRPGRNTPFTWPVRGRISQSYGCTGSGLSPARGGCASFHDGIDVVSGRGAIIRSAGVGVISYIGRNPWDRGKRAFMVVVAHPGGYETLYAHVLPIRRVKVGQLVRKGQRIAFMGSTGHSTGTHLHLELRRGRTTLNPLAFL